MEGAAQLQLAQEQTGAWAVGDGRLRATDYSGSQLPRPNMCCSASPPGPAQVNVFLEGNKDLPSLTPTSTHTSSGGGSGLSVGAVAGICVGGALRLGWPDGWGAGSCSDTVWSRAERALGLLRLHGFCDTAFVPFPLLQPCWAWWRWRRWWCGPSSGGARSAARRRASAASSTGELLSRGTKLNFHTYLSLTACCINLRLGHMQVLGRGASCQPEPATL